MKHSIIKNYQQWVNESFNSINEADDAANSIVLISASTSKSNITPDLATKMGIQKDMTYTINFASNTDFYNALFGLANTKSFTAAKVQLGTPTKTASAGLDVLSIAGKQINETGTIMLTKAELSGPVTVTLSNNGALCLMRASTAVRDAFTAGFLNGKSSSDIRTCKDYAIKFTMGTDVAEATGKGYSLFISKPGDLAGTATMLADTLAQIVLSFGGSDATINKADPVRGTYYKFMVDPTKNKTAEEAVASSLQKIATGSLLKRNMLANSNPDASSVKIADFIANKASYLKDVQVGNKGTIKNVTDAGRAAFDSLIQQAVAAIAPSQTIEGWPGAESVVSQYGEIIKAGLRIQGTRIDDEFRDVQSTNQYGASSQNAGVQKTGTVTQGEGQY